MRALARAVAAFVPTVALFAATESVRAAPSTTTPSVTPNEPSALPGDGSSPGAARRVDEPSQPKRSAWDRARDRWLLAVEGVVNAPTDLGFQAGVELPFRLRLFGGVGFLQVEPFTDLVGNATTNPNARAILQAPDYGGTIWRAKLGIRPFPTLGLYLDGGYARANLNGTADISSNILAEEIGVDGVYEIASSIDLWLLELGYQWQIARRGVVALGLGVMSTFDADTTISSTNDQVTDEEIALGAELANATLKQYGTVPQLTLRVGVDLL